MKYYSIAVDGPAGAGKSTIAKKVAAELGFVYIDTGAMYRAMAVYFLKKGIDACDEETIVSVLDDVDIRLSYAQDGQHVFLNGCDITANLRSEEVGSMASVTSGYFKVREKLVSLQQKLALSENVIMDGRDIGSVVLPNADLKIYLFAGTQVRAKRRYDELTAKGIECDIEQIAKDIDERDYRDMHRANSPLICVEDAIKVDSSYMTIEEVSAEVVRLFKNKVSQQ